MNENIIYPSLLIIVGILLATAVIIFLTRFFNKIIRLFELYPESKGILNISSKFISWFSGLIIFLIFVRWALQIWKLEFTTKLIEKIIMTTPKYILASFIILCGFYISRIIREKSKDYNFKYKNRILIIIDLIVHMTFIFTALYSINVNILFFIELYKVILWTIGSIVTLIISIVIGIPLGMSIYKRKK
ncbi:MAG: hypothetical protein PHF86_06995 [Candidatus Nanoarchaeia archaeon]|nr:hypothetical protein [Candidatus Nanoarchaeia archaeon]